jgi:hypothetical protein
VLQNYAADDVEDMSRYAIEIVQGGYVPLTLETGADYDLFIDVAEQIKSEVMEAEPVTPLYKNSLVVLYDLDQDFTNNTLTRLQWDNVFVEWEDDWTGPPDYLFSPVKTGYYRFTVDVALGPTSLFDNWSDDVRLYLTDHNDNVLRLLNHRTYNTGGTSQIFWIHGDVVEHVYNTASVAFALKHTAGGTVSSYNGLTVYWCWASIQGIPEYIADERA